MFERCDTKRLLKKTLLFVFVVIFFSISYHLVNYAYQKYKANEGTTAVINGVISDKQYIAAHTTTSGCFLFFSTDYQPDKYSFTIRRFDSGKKAWETAKIDVDKDTYNKYSRGENYADTSGKTTFFHVAN